MHTLLPHAQSCKQLHISQALQIPSQVSSQSQTFGWPLTKLTSIFKFLILFL